MRPDPSNKPHAPVNKTSSTKRKALTNSLKNQVATLSTRVATLELELAAKQDAITKQDAIIQARDSQLQHLHRTYKHLCKLFFKAACCDFTDPEIPDCLQPNPNHRAHTGRRPRSLADDAEQQATKEFRRILAASSRSSLGLSAPSSTDEPEPDV